MDWSNRLGKRIKLRDLHILQAAAEAGSMVKAASDLAMSQPAVSYAVAEMEHALGVPLLERSSQGVTPTIYGEVLLERSRVVFNELRLGINEIGSLADPSVGELRLGTTPPMSAIASAVFNRLVPRYPRMTLCPQRRTNPCPASRAAPAGHRARHQPVGRFRRRRGSRRGYAVPR